MMSVFDNSKTNYCYRLKPFILVICTIAFTSCGFYLRGSKTIENQQNIDYVQIINFSSKLKNYFIDQVNGVKTMQAGSQKNPNATNSRIVKIGEEKINQSEELLDITTYNKEININLSIFYTIENAGNDQPAILKPNTIELKSRIQLSEADRLSGEKKIQQAQDSLYQELALRLLQAILIN